jgi:hypothetical protein
MYERMKGTHAALVDILTLINSMTLTLENLNIISRIANYREQQRSSFDTSSEAEAHCAGVDLETGKIVRMTSEYVVVTRDFLTVVIMSRLGIRPLSWKGRIYRIGAYMLFMQDF